MLLSIIYCTARVNPRFDLLEKSLQASAKKHPHIKWELIIVDALRDERPDVCAPPGHIWLAPKPTPWQGKHRLTSKDYWAKASANNTGAAYARGAHLVYLDDCMYVHEDFLMYHWAAAAKNYVIAGSMISVIGEPPNATSFKVYADDPRTLWNGVPLEMMWKKRPAKETELYGSNWSAPLSLILAVDGHDEAYDGQRAFEDIDIGVRLNRARPNNMFFVPDCLVWQLMDNHTPAPPDVSGTGNRELLKRLKEDSTRVKPLYDTNLQWLRTRARHNETLPMTVNAVGWRNHKHF